MIGRMEDSNKKTDEPISQPPRGHLSLLTQLAATALSLGQSSFEHSGKVYNVRTYTAAEVKVIEKVKRKRTAARKARKVSRRSR